MILWVPAENHLASGFGSDGLEDKETWRAKHMCRSSGAEIYDLAWSPDAAFFIIGSMDNIARIYNAGTGTYGTHPFSAPCLGRWCIDRLLTFLFLPKGPSLDKLPNIAITSKALPGTR